MTALPRFHVPGETRPLGGGTLRLVRWTFVIGGGIYLALAVLGHARERSGSMTCACQADCWCKRPGLSVFRWVLPFGHSMGRP